ncbi:hypothetical protein Trydic_g4937 [Trypoxylus dichotomus]
MRGVPQSCILGQLLFLLYANDLSQISQHQSSMCADDTSVIIRGTNGNPENEVISTLRRFADWFDVHDMALNIDKTKLINFSYCKKDHRNIAFKYKILTTCENTRFFGLTIGS